jgi:hypothetical protein
LHNDFIGDFIMAATVYDALRVLTPTAVFSVAGNTYAGIQWMSPNIPQPTEAQVVAEQATLDAQAPFTACSNQASALLTATDWTTIPDVANPAVSNPYLTNQSAFLSYRSAVRQIGVYPVANPVWPVQPTPAWANSTSVTNTNPA